MAGINVYMDEHVQPAVPHGLSLRGVDVLTTQDADRLGSADEEQLAFATGQERVLFSQDADFLRLHASGVEHNGIVYSHQHTGVSTLIRGLMLIHDVLDSTDMVKHVEFIS